MKNTFEGFTGQRLMRLPETVVERAADLPVCRDVRTTDLGHFPEASRHEVRRPQGCPQHIVILCVSGEGWVSFGHGRRQRVTAGGLLVIPSGCPHAYGAASENPWRLYWVHFTGERADDYLDLLRAREPGTVLSVSGVTEVCEGFETLWRHREEGGSDPGLIRMSAELSRLLVLLYIHTRAGEAPRGTEERIERVLTCMRERVSDALSLADFARVAGVSVPHFCALFRAQTGVPPMTYFSRLRMRRAAEWLDGSNEPVSVIAQRVGYENPFHFSRAFRSTHGLSPRAYRQRIRG
jgi:AraC-like DNA-binding protein